MAAIAAGLTWWALDATRSRASWVELRVSQPLVASQSSRFAVRLEPHLTNGYLALDLHWRTRQRENRRVLVAGRPQPIDGSVREYVFDFRLPSNPDLGAITAVLYAGPTANWLDRRFIAFSDPLDVHPQGSSMPSPETESILKRVSVFVPEDSSLPPLETSLLHRHLSAVMLLGAALGLLWKRYRTAAAGTRSYPDDSWRSRIRASGLPIFLSMLALSEVSGIANWVTQGTRDLAKASQLYAFRQDFQRPLTVMVVAMGCACVVLVARARMPLSVRAVWVGALAYLLLSTAGCLSLHEFDALMVGSVAGATYFEWLKISASAFVLGGVVRYLGSATTSGDGLSDA